LFELFDVDPKASFKIDREQIDGAFILDELVDPFPSSRKTGAGWRGVRHQPPGKVPHAAAPSCANKTAASTDHER